MVIKEVVRATGEGRERGGRSKGEGRERGGKELMWRRGRDLM